MTEFEERQERCKEIAEVAGQQYRAFLDDGLSCEDARILTAAVMAASQFVHIISDFIKKR